MIKFNVVQVQWSKESDLTKLKNYQFGHFHITDENKKEWNQILLKLPSNTIVLSQNIVGTKGLTGITFLPVLINNSFLIWQEQKEDKLPEEIEVKNQKDGLLGVLGGSWFPSFSDNTISWVSIFTKPSTQYIKGDKGETGDKGFIGSSYYCSSYDATEQKISLYARKRLAPPIVKCEQNETNWVIKIINTNSTSVGVAYSINSMPEKFALLKAQSSKIEEKDNTLIISDFMTKEDKTVDIVVKFTSTKQYMSITKARFTFQDFYQSPILNPKVKSDVIENGLIFYFYNPNYKKIKVQLIHENYFSNIIEIQPRSFQSFQIDKASLKPLKGMCDFIIKTNDKFESLYTARYCLSSEEFGNILNSQLGELNIQLDTLNNQIMGTFIPIFDPLIINYLNQLKTLPYLQIIRQINRKRKNHAIYYRNKNTKGNKMIMHKTLRTINTREDKQPYFWSIPSQAERFTLTVDMLKQGSFNFTATKFFDQLQHWSPAHHKDIFKFAIFQAQHLHHNAWVSKESFNLLDF